MTKKLEDKCEGAVIVKFKGKIRNDAKWVIPDEQGNVLYSGKNLNYMLKKYRAEHPKEVPIVISIDKRLSNYLILSAAH